VQLPLLTVQTLDYSVWFPIFSGFEPYKDLLLFAADRLADTNGFG